MQIVIINDIIKPVVGIFLIPTLVSIIGTFLYEKIRNRKKEYSLSYVSTRKRSYKLSENGDIKISVSYKGENISSTLSVYSLRIENVGKKDIFFKQHFDTFINISLPGWHFIGASIKDECNKANPNISIAQDGSADLSWDIFKREENINIEFVALENDIKPERYCENFIFKFRADCIDEITKNVQSMRNIFRLIFLLFAVSIACVALLPSRAETLLNVNYQGHSYTNATIRYNYYNKSFIIISKDEKIKLSRGELNALDIAITPKQDKSWELAYFITICVLVLIGCALMAFILHKYKKGEIPSTIMLTLLSKH